MLTYYLNILKIFQSFLNFLLVFILNIRYALLKGMKTKVGSRVHVLGNGPSLSKELNHIRILVENGTDSIFVVNSFAESSYFKILKPSHYFIIDPAFFENNPVSRTKQQREKIIDSFSINLNWPIILFLPAHAKNSDFSGRLSKIPNVKIKFFKNVPVLGGFQKFNCLLYRFNLANPLFQNVLIGAIFCAIKNKSKEVYVWGADHSWHKELSILNGNVVYNSSHFYNEGKHVVVKESNSRKKLLVHEEFAKFSRVFSAYHELNLLASRNGSKIINMTKGSWIDAFPRN